jgi:hypothetical protein
VEEGEKEEEKGMLSFFIVMLVREGFVLLALYLAFFFTTLLRLPDGQFTPISG